MVELFALALGAVIVPFLVLGLARFLDTVLQGPPWLTDLAGRFRQLRIWHLIAAVLVCGLTLAVLRASDEIPLFLAGVAILVVFVRTWCHEFYTLMALEDKALPGRFDKPIWAFLMIVLAPVGVWLFRSYRLAHWPEPAPEPSCDGVAAEVS